MFTDYDGDMPDFDGIKIEEEVPVFVTRNLVMFPGILMPVLVGRKATLELVRFLEENPETIFVIVSQKDGDVEYPKSKDIYRTGIYVKLIRAFDMPGSENGESRTVVLQGLGRCHLDEITSTTPFMHAKTSKLSDELVDKDDKEFLTAVNDMKDTLKEYIHGSDELPDDAQFAVDNISHPIAAVNYVCSNMPFPVYEKMLMLKENSVKDRLFRLMKLLNREIQFQHLRQNIRSKTREDIEEQQREYFLH